MISLYLPIIAVFLGYLIALKIKSHSKYLNLLLAFSGGFLLAVTVVSLLPEIYQEQNHLIGIFILLGIVLQLVLEFFSKGAEHGHVHFEQKGNTFPLLLFISLSIHSFFEGFPTHQHSDLLIGILVHKIPVAIIVSSFLLSSKLSKTKLIVFLILFSLMTPLGSLVHIIFEQDLGDIKIWVEAIVVGILLHIASTILFETSKDHQFNYKKFISILIGMGLAVVQSLF
ncbi:ZIP family metal transporter [Flavobacteriaceae bacterium 14752]|uniref:ZIP family metal transporter n=1 Tax=Mesohalobacter salilacus TaxID=2491711 RepID=UPI000F63DA7D|nr:ZIP family metal transporter [Flavobacteriaceae bacterium 14752]